MLTPCGSGRAAGKGSRRGGGRRPPRVDERDRSLAGRESPLGPLREATASGPAICRTENVSACHRGVAELVDGPLRDVASSAIGERVVAFKDKINYKQPGGAGFRPHQDRVAYPGVIRVMSILVAIDACSTESGCLWLAGGVDDVLPTDDRGVVRDDIARDAAVVCGRAGAGRCRLPRRAGAALQRRQPNGAAAACAGRELRAGERALHAQAVLRRAH